MLDLPVRAASQCELISLAQASPNWSVGCTDPKHLASTGGSYGKVTVLKPHVPRSDSWPHPLPSHFTLSAVKWPSSYHAGSREDWLHTQSRPNRRRWSPLQPCTNRGLKEGPPGEHPANQGLLFVNWVGIGGVIERQVTDHDNRNAQRNVL